MFNAFKKQIYKLFPTFTNPTPLFLPKNFGAAFREKQDKSCFSAQLALILQSDE